jgi:hypothetical protein
VMATWQPYTVSQNQPIPLKVVRIEVRGTRGMNVEVKWLNTMPGVPEEAQTQIYLTCGKEVNMKPWERVGKAKSTYYRHRLRGINGSGQMPSFIDHKVRVETSKSGKFLEGLANLIPYADYVGYTTAIRNEQKAVLEAIASIKYEKDEEEYKLTQQQKLVLEAIRNGHRDTESIKQEIGSKLPANTQYANTKRVIHNLHKLKLIKGGEGTYTLK